MRLEDLPPFLRVPEVQEVTQLSRSQVYAQCRLWHSSGGKAGIPNVPFGHCLRIPAVALVRMALAEPDSFRSDGAGG